MKPLTEENYSLGDLANKKVYIRPGFDLLLDDEEKDSPRAYRAIKWLTNRAGVVDTSWDYKNERMLVVFDDVLEDLSEKEDEQAFIGEQSWVVKLEDLSFTSWIKPLTANQKTKLEEAVNKLKQIGNYEQSSI